MKLQETEWVEQQDPAFINNLHQLGNIVQNLSTQVYLFLDLFAQYVEAMQAAPLFSTGSAAPSDEHGNVSPTQTPVASAPTNREQRRSQAKAEKKLLTPPAKKLIVP